MLMGAVRVPRDATDHRDDDRDDADDNRKSLYATCVKEAADETDGVRLRFRIGPAVKELGHAARSDSVGIEKVSQRFLRALIFEQWS